MRATLAFLSERYTIKTNTDNVLFLFTILQREFIMYKKTHLALAFITITNGLFAMNSNGPQLQIMVGKKRTSFVGSQAKGCNRSALKALNVATPALAFGCGAGIAGAAFSYCGNPDWAAYSFKAAGTSCGAGCTALGTAAGKGGIGYVLNKIDRKKNPINYAKTRTITLQDGDSLKVTNKNGIISTKLSTRHQKKPSNNTRPCRRRKKRRK